MTEQKTTTALAGADEATPSLAQYGPHADNRGDGRTRFLTLRNLSWRPSRGVSTWTNRSGPPRENPDRSLAAAYGSPDPTVKTRLSL